MIRKFDHLTKLDATDPMPMTLGPLVRDESALVPTALRDCGEATCVRGAKPEQWKRVSQVHRNEVFGDKVRRYTPES